jgi:hypothetical protein
MKARQSSKIRAEALNNALLLVLARLGDFPSIFHFLFEMEHHHKKFFCNYACINRALSETGTGRSVGRAAPGKPRGALGSSQRASGEVFRPRGHPRLNQEAAE